mgnify:CR=1 FL=1
MKYLGIYLILMNLLALTLMGVDKRRARAGKWRIRERTLFLSAALGGSVGAILGMQLFRHKTKHKSFTIGMPMILLVQIVIAGFLWFQS